MPKEFDFDALVRESDRLRIYFLERELELSQTFVALGHRKIALGESSQVHRILEKVQRAIETVHDFTGKISSVDEQTRIPEQLAKIENAAAELEALVKPQPQ